MFMKAGILLGMIVLFSCNGKEDYRKADDALDAGRAFIQSSLEGDFSKAAFYLQPDAKNKAILAETEKAYREKDKEGRQQFRTASINIKQVMDITSNITLIKYSNSFDTLPHSILVIKQNGEWHVDLTNTLNPTN